MLRTDDSLTLKASLSMSNFLKICSSETQFFAWTFYPIKTKHVQTNINFGRKMSDVRSLFQALQSKSDISMNSPASILATSLE